ncbi:hypothetical protein GZ77_08505 [Endozoicomonas montiporae]|uniref:DUF2860 domain-containing protein n=2 Tax=Endozoicomonas montiporae TaxID=1027273 RepID=A0A081N7I6_9GAMM|nr:DUF2860 domain-containing protein [Endozoicomonas montiporae]AMO55750.1 periplasmic protein [Endozoicomonas montiporae CL-33]KEQ14409.1 hypothetical protein GZ77_08505 [Endozoicomonas montiporae]
MNTRLFVVLVSAFSSPALMAAQSGNWQPGFSGEVSLLTGYSQSKSQFNADYKQTDALDSASKRKSKALFMPLFSLQYTLNEGDSQFYVGSDRADVALGRFHTEIGYRQSLQENGVISASIIPGVIPNKTWQDPFVTGQKRKETDTYIQALRFQFTNIMNSGFSLEVAGGKQKLDKERSGQSDFDTSTQKQLNREGNVYLVEGAYRFPVSRTLFVRTGLNHTRLSADGDAMSYQANALELGLFTRWQQSSMAFNLSYQVSQHDKTSPVFAKKQKDHEWGAFLAYSYAEPFGWNNWELVSLSGYSRKNSNIDFYDEDSLMVSVGMTYKF